MGTSSTTLPAATRATTIGMRIDFVIAKIDSIVRDIPISTTYQAFIIVCCLFAFVVLNYNDPPTATSTAHQDHLKSLQTFDKTHSHEKKSTSSNKTPQKQNNEPQPKWHILKLLNIVSVIGLLTSFGWFASNASTYLNDTHALIKFMAIWSTFLCYFFGFFGISFIDADDLESEATSVKNTTKLSSHVPSQKTQKKTTNLLPIHPPAACTPICSDVTTTVSNKQTSSSLSSSSNIQDLDDSEIAKLVISDKIKDHQLEKLTTPRRAVKIRREAFEIKLSTLNNSNALTDLPYEHDLDYARVYGANCETVIGYVPLPVGMVGPLTLNNETVYFPMATTEGCLVASTNRGCKAISQGSGAISTIMRDGITRAPCVRMDSAKDAALFKIWCEQHENFIDMKKVFESTTTFGKLEGVHVTVAGRNAYIRLRCFSGDAMGMNMVSKGSLAVIEYLKGRFPSLSLLALSGNMCTDKKAAAVNWIEGRGKSVVVEATIPKDVVRSTLKTDVKTIVNVNMNKNLVGSAMAGVIGGFNAHAANIVTALFLATGQDPAQNVESSNCITLMEETENGDLWISCTMPSIEVGTVGGGTGLAAQSAGLKVIGCKGGGEIPGGNAKKLANVVASAVMAGELSLLAALAANTLVQAHLQHNRKPATK